MTHAQKICSKELFWHLITAPEERFENRCETKQALTEQMTELLNNMESGVELDTQTNTAAQLLNVYMDMTNGRNRTKFLQNMSPTAAHFWAALDTVVPIRTHKPIVYLAGPYSGDIDQNIRRIIIAARHAILQEHVLPIVPHLLFPTILDDENPEERALGLELDMGLIALCEELWYYGDKITAGMQQELDFAKKHGIKIIHKDWPDEKPTNKRPNETHSHQENTRCGPKSEPKQVTGESDDQIELDLSQIFPPEIADVIRGIIRHTGFEEPVLIHHKIVQDDNNGCHIQTQKIPLKTVHMAKPKTTGPAVRIKCRSCGIITDIENCPVKSINCNGRRITTRTCPNCGDPVGLMRIEN